MSGAVYGQMAGTGLTAYAILAVNQVPENTDRVILNTPTGPVTVPFLTDVSGFAEYVYSTPVTAVSPSYQVNGTYSMSVSTSIGTATSGSVNAPGNITVSASGTGVTWTSEGNLDSVVVTNASGPTTTYNSTTAIGPDIDSPFTIPGSAYPLTGGVTYNISPQITNQTTTFTGAATGSSFQAYQKDPTTVVK